MSSAMHDPIRDDRFDRFDGEIRRFLEWDSSQIDGAPSRAAMLERLLDVRGLVGARQLLISQKRHHICEVVQEIVRGALRDILDLPDQPPRLRGRRNLSAISG